MEVDDDLEDDDMDFNPFLREESPSETSSSLTSEAECEEISFGNQPSGEVHPHSSVGNESPVDWAPSQNRLPSEGTCKEHIPENISTQVYSENGEVALKGLEKEPLPTESSFSPAAQSSRQLFLEGSEEDAICRRTRARYSLANYALEELETFLQESDDDGDLPNVDEEEEYRKFLTAVLSGGGNDTQVCQVDENQDEDENDADFELEIEEALESDGDENAENYDDLNGRNEKDGRRPQTRQKRPKFSREGDHHQESTKSTLRPILPYISPTLLAPGHAYGWQYPSQSAPVASSLLQVAVSDFVYGFTDQQLGQLHILIYEHVQLMIQTFSLCVLDPSKQCVAADVKKLIVQLVSCRDQALARRNTLLQQLCFQPQHLRSSFSSASSDSLESQWIPIIKNPVVSILDVSPLHLALGYLSDVATAVVKYRRSHVDGSADKNHLRKEPLFPSAVLSTREDADNISQTISSSVPISSSASPGQLRQKKSLAATLVENTKKEPVAFVQSDIARLAQRFFPFFNFSLVPHKPPLTAMANRVLFTDAEDGLLALGIMEYNNDWGAIQKRFLPCKSKHQIFVRQKNRSSSKAPDNPIKDVRHMKTSPLTMEEIQRIQEGLKIFRNDWTSVWRFMVPHRDPSLLQRQWRVATGVQKSYSKSEAAKEKRRSYEAKRRKLRASMPDSCGVREQEADNYPSEGVENDDDSYVNEAFLADTENRSMNMISCQLSLPTNAGKSIMMQSGLSLNGECGISDGPSSNRVSGGTLNQPQASQLCHEKGSLVVKLAPDLPPVNLPPSARVISQMSFHHNATHLNGTSDNAAKDMFPVPPPTFTESVYRQLNLFPGHSTSVRSQQNGITNGNVVEDSAEQDFQMHPLLFQYPGEMLSSYRHPVQSLDHSRKYYDLFPFEKVQVEKGYNHTTDATEREAQINSSTIGFHPLLQRTDVQMHNVLPEDDCHPSVNRSEYRMGEPPVDDQSTARQASRSPCDRENCTDLQASTSPRERENNIDLNIDLISSMTLRNAKDFKGTSRKSNIQAEGSTKDRDSISELEANVYSPHRIEEPSEEEIQGIVMEQEELSDSEEDSQHVEFECEEMDDSEEEQVHEESSFSQNKEISTTVVCAEFPGNNDQCRIQEGLVHVGKQVASSGQKSQGPSIARSARAKVKPEHTKSTGSRANQRLSTSHTSEPSPLKTRRSKMMQGEASAERKPSDPRSSRKNLDLS